MKNPDMPAKRKLELGALKGEGLEKLVEETLAVPADILASVKATRQFPPLSPHDARHR